MLNKLRVRVQEEKGFTLVELLVVMLILGLLAAIAIPSFFNQRDKARDADAKASVRTAQTAMETYATDHGGDYTPTPTQTQLTAIENSLANIPAGDLTAVSTDDTYTVTVDSATGENTFSITRASSGALTYPCTTPDNDGCPTGGWGG